MLLAGSISNTSTQYIDYVDIFNILLDLSIYFAHFSGVELLLCVYLSIYPRIL